MRFGVLKYYDVVTQVACDPRQASCFVAETESQPDTFAVAMVPAYLLESCDPWSGQCREITCTSGDACTIEYCVGPDCTGGSLK